MANYINCHILFSIHFTIVYNYDVYACCALIGTLFHKETLAISRYGVEGDGVAALSCGVPYRYVYAKFILLPAANAP